MTQEKMQEHLEFWSSNRATDLLSDLADCIDQSSASSKAVNRDMAILKAKERFASRGSPDEINIALQVVLGRQSAKSLAWNGSGFFLKTQLEQASHPILAEYHAQPFNGHERVCDFCSGLGFDSGALAKVAKQVIALERDPLVAAFCLLNLRAQGFDNVQVVCSEVEEYVKSDPNLYAAGIWADPDRRSSGNRIRATAEGTPSLDFLSQLKCSGPLGVKVSPLAHDIDDSWKREFIGFERECKEQILWQYTDHANLSVALPQEGALWKLLDNVARPVLANELDVGAVLLEPHAALVASGAWPAFLASSGLLLLERAQLGYCKITPQKSSWYNCFRIIEVCAFRTQEVNKTLAKLAWGSASSIKKAGVPESAEQLRTGLKFVNDSANDNHNQVIYVMQCGKQKLACFCMRQ